MKRILGTLVLTGLILLGPVAAQARIYVVAVGIAKYKENPLHLPVTDAKAVKFVYDHHNDTQTMLITDEQATREHILAQIQAVFGKASEKDIVVLFFSGHGYKGGFCAYDGMLSYNAIRKTMAMCKSKNKMIFADACFAGNMRQNRESSNAQNSMKKSNVMLFLSSRSTETSLESKKMVNGYFTDALQKALRGGADENRDRTITARELFNYVSSKVRLATNERQHPVMWGRFPDNMPVISW